MQIPVLREARAIAAASIGPLTGPEHGLGRNLQRDIGWWKSSVDLAALGDVEKADYSAWIIASASTWANRIDWQC